MLYWAIVFLAISIVAGLLGFKGTSEVAGKIAKFLFLLFFTLFVILVVLIVTGK